MNRGLLPSGPRAPLGGMPGFRRACRGVCSGSVSAKPRPYRAAAVLATIATVLGLPALAQNDPSARQREHELRRQWSEACNRAMEGHPWDEIAVDLELALTVAGETDHSDLISGYLDSIRQAEAQSQSLPPNDMQATPEERVALLMESRLLNPRQTDSALIYNPLHFTRRQPGRPRVIHWVQLGDVPEHDTTDPAIRIFKRGRAMIPHLLDALDDMTTTRSAYIARVSNRPAVMCRRCDLALALLEAVTRCRFSPVKRDQWFSLSDEATREAVIQLARRWWTETKDLPALDARSWLIERITYQQAEPMIDVLAAEEETERTIRHLRTFLYNDTGQLQIEVGQRLARLGDRSALNGIAERAGNGERIARNEIALLTRYGGRREYMLLRRMVAEDKHLNQKTKNQVSKTILQALEKTDNRLAIPVLAEAVDVEDPIVDSAPLRSRAANNRSRADIAAEHIQRLTQRDFRYDPQAKKSARIKAIERIRRWWENEGRAFYGFGAARVRRTGGIR